MDIMDAMAGRRSVRAFLDRPVAPQLVRELVEAAVMAPSACNRQDWEFSVVTSHELKKRMAEVVAGKWAELLAGCESESVRDALSPYCGNFEWFIAAPVVLAVTCKAPDDFLVALCGNATAAADIAGMKTSAAMAVQNLMLAAHAQGLGTCCLTGPVAAVDALRPLLSLGRRRELVCLVALGYPMEQSPAPPRKPVEDVVHHVDDPGKRA